MKLIKGPVKGYKGFDKNMRCRGFQYKEGETYEHSGDIELCDSGFHYCENPLDVFSYYPPGESDFHEVSAENISEEKSDDSKRVCKKLTIGASVSIKSMVDIAVKFIFDRVDWKNQKETNTGYRSAATNTGYQSAATNTGYQSAATNTGYRSAATNTGYRSAATNTGDYSAATNTGDYSAATNTGYQSAVSVDGNGSVACGLGYDNTAKGSIGCWLVLADRKDSGELKSVKTVMVDGKKIKADTWYHLVRGKFARVK